MNVQGRMFIYIWIGLKLFKCEGQDVRLFRMSHSSQPNIVSIAHDQQILMERFPRQSWLKGKHVITKPVIDLIISGTSQDTQLRGTY